MCSVLISEREASQIDTATVTIVSIAVAGTVGASGISTAKVTDDYDYSHSVKT
jgi:ABC-type methionine transport system permease subunit